MLYCVVVVFRMLHWEVGFAFQLFALIDGLGLWWLCLVICVFCFRISVCLGGVLDGLRFQLGLGVGLLVGFVLCYFDVVGLLSSLVLLAGCCVWYCVFVAGLFEFRRWV